MASSLNIILTAIHNCLSLTPEEKWQAAREFNTLAANRYFIGIGIVAVAIFIIALIFISRKQNAKHENLQRLFNQTARNHGLSGDEGEMLLDIVEKAGIKEPHMIFTMPKALDSGAMRILKKSVEKKGVEKTMHLKAKYLFLREKLGFEKQPLAAAGHVDRLRKLSSRQIPVGKKVRLSNYQLPGADTIEAEVTKNDRIGLTLHLETELEAAAIKSWRVRYPFGAYLWEFDSFALHCDAKILVLNHSDNVRFISRRRFYRVAVEKSAQISKFPFMRSFGAPSREDQANNDKNKNSSLPWSLPKFEQGLIIELAGPGLKIRSPLQVKTNDRVLIIFQLENEAGEQDNKVKIIEDIGQVKRVQQKGDDYIFAVELIGLSDRDINELLKATNSASVKQKQLEDNQRIAQEQQEAMLDIPEEA